MNINFTALDPKADMPQGLKIQVQSMQDQNDFYVLNFKENVPDGAEVIFADGQDYMMKIIAVPKGGSALAKGKPRKPCLV